MEKEKENESRVTSEWRSGTTVEMNVPLGIIRTFRKHLQLFHKKGVSIHDENGHYFTVDDSFRQKIDAMVRKLSG